MFPEINYFEQFLRKNIKTKFFFSMCPQNWKIEKDYMYVACKENLSG